MRTWLESSGSSSSSIVFVATKTIIIIIINLLLIQGERGSDGLASARYIAFITILQRRYSQ